MTDGPIFKLYHKIPTKPDKIVINQLSPILKGYWDIQDSRVIDNTVQKQKSNDDREIGSQLMLPKKRVTDLLQELHNGSGERDLVISKTGETARKLHSGQGRIFMNLMFPENL